MRSTERVRVACAAAGLDVEIRIMPQSTRTAEEAAAACGVAVGQIVKSLIFRKAMSGEPVLLLVAGVNRVDQQATQTEIGEPLERMDAAAVREITGFAIGGVAPLGLLTPLATYMDEDLLAFETIWAAAGAPDAVFGTDPKALAKATGATLVKMRT
jgi:prolyl-tRNA editing enzyme YbaK/EbsC (Cys-tRNA(Pro) deacylase)